MKHYLQIFHFLAFKFVKIAHSINYLWKVGLADIRHRNMSVDAYKKFYRNPDETGTKDCDSIGILSLNCTQTYIATSYMRDLCP